MHKNRFKERIRKVKRTCTPSFHFSLSLCLCVREDSRPYGFSFLIHHPSVQKENKPSNLSLSLPLRSVWSNLSRSSVQLCPVCLCGNNVIKSGFVLGGKQLCECLFCHVIMCPFSGEREMLRVFRVHSVRLRLLYSEFPSVSCQKLTRHLPYIIPHTH